MESYYALYIIKSLFIMRYFETFNKQSVIDFLAEIFMCKKVLFFPKTKQDISLIMNKIHMQVTYLTAYLH